MALVGKLVSQIDIKSDGDVFHEIFRERPHHISGMSPTNIQKCDLHDGEWGTVGSVIFWNYTHDGENRVAKEIIEAIDEEKKSVTFKVVEGDLMKLYKTFKLTVHVDTKGDDNLVTWTFDYEKLNEDVPEPQSLMDFCLAVTKDIETHHLDKQPNELVGRLVSQIDIRSDGDVFHEIFRDRPHHLSDMTPDKIQNCDLHDGDWGKVGSIICFNYTHDGKEKIAKEIIEAIDEEKKSVTFKVIGGDLLEVYKTFKLTVHVDTFGEDNIVTWTLDYEKLSADVPDPQTLMDFCLQVTKDIETHHLDKQPNELVGRMISQIDIKSDGDVFHEIFRDRPHHLSDMTPDKIQNCDLHDGDWGKVGSIICFNYTHDGKEKVAKEIIEAIDEEKKSVTFKVVEGDLLEAYKTFKLTVHVDTYGEDNIVTWTLDYEKLNADVPDPQTLMDFCLQVTKDIETHHLK